MYHTLQCLFQSMWVDLNSVRPLLQVIGELVEDGGVIQINDKKLLSTLRVKLKYSDQQDMQT